MSFTASHFFDLSEYTHRTLFAGNAPVWTSLERLVDYLTTCRLGTHFSGIPDGAVLVRPEQIYIGHACVIQPGAYVEGPCYIGDGCEIRHGAFLRGRVLLGSSCVVGHATEVKNAVFFDEAKAPHFNYVGDTILGRRANLGAGVKCANVRLDRKEVVVHEQGARICTGRRKLGAIIGDGCQLGCNSVTNPGAFLEKGVACAPCSVLSGYVRAK